ncbi:MAG: hypothetical protein ACPIOQ_21585, partial [Promethearchaeia archaeon]
MYSSPPAKARAPTPPSAGGVLAPQEVDASSPAEVVGQTLAGRAAAPAAESGPSATDLSEVHASSVVTLETALITALSEAGPVGPGDAWAPEALQAWREGTAGSAGAVQAEEAERPQTVSTDVHAPGLASLAAALSHSEARTSATELSAVRPRLQPLTRHTAMAAELRPFTCSSPMLDTEARASSEAPTSPFSVHSEGQAP